MNAEQWAARINRVTAMTYDPPLPQFTENDLLRIADGRKPLPPQPQVYRHGRMVRGSSVRQRIYTTRGDGT